jgi:hypothetical protein
MRLGAERLFRTQFSTERDRNYRQMHYNSLSYISINRGIAYRCEAFENLEGIQQWF